MVETNKNGGNSGSCEEILVGDDEGERSVASVEDQIRKEMTIYEVCDVNLGIIWRNCMNGCLKLFCCFFFWLSSYKFQISQTQDPALKDIYFYL